MSVILTATKKAVHPKGSKAKKRKESQPSHPKRFDPTPPVSTSKTTVWHWELDSRPTTIMFEKADGTVWCNGKSLNTQSQFAEVEGGVIDFVLEVKSGKGHTAQIKRITTGSAKDGIVYQLVVDGISILEHNAKQPDLPTPEAIGAMAAPPAYYEDPSPVVPGYDKKMQ